MGQKVNPHGFRVGAKLNKTWGCLWYADGKDYSRQLLEDYNIIKAIQSALNKTGAGVSNVKISRPNKKAIIDISVARPGVVIDKKGTGIEKLKAIVSKLTKAEVFINIIEVKKPETDAYISADTIAKQIEKRVSFRRAMKKAIQACMKLGAKGIKVSVSGRLGGAEIARTEWYREGRVPLHTLRADIDYGVASAHTTYGVIGIKVWIYKGDTTEE